MQVIVILLNVKPCDLIEFKTRILLVKVFPDATCEVFILDHRIIREGGLCCIVPVVNVISEQHISKISRICRYLDLGNIRCRLVGFGDIALEVILVELCNDFFHLVIQCFLCTLLRQSRGDPLTLAFPFAISVIKDHILFTVFHGDDMLKRQICFHDIFLLTLKAVNALLTF